MCIAALKVMRINVWMDIVSYKKQDDSKLCKVSAPCIDDHHFKEEDMKSIGVVKSMFSNYFEMLTFGTYWKTRYSRVSEQTCTIDYEMDESLWQTIISFDLFHDMWI